MPGVAVVGAGTMGAGIAQVAAAAGWTVRLFDVHAGTLARAEESIRKGLHRLAEKGKLAAADRDAALSRLHFGGTVEELAANDLVVEAIIEDLAAKVQALRPLVEKSPRATIFASNTSSLSISSIGDGIGRPQSTVGMHFFNPVPLMPLVEVIAGRRSEASAADRVAEIAAVWGKTVVRAKDTPGFIVNRVARGYYLESLRMLEEGVAGVDEIDRVLKTLGGFRMGPFELMDLIGIDVNYNVSVSVWDQLARPARLTPHPIQKRLFEEGKLGRKAGQGFYSYAYEPPIPAIPVHRASFDCPPSLYKAVRRFVDGATSESGSITEQYVFARVVSTVINEAALLAGEDGATPADIDTAMKLGTNYPFGPLELAARVGRHTCAGLLRAMNEQVADGRFDPAEWLQQ